MGDEVSEGPGVSAWQEAGSQTHICHKFQSLCCFVLRQTLDYSSVQVYGKNNIYNNTSDLHVLAAGSVPGA